MLFLNQTLENKFKLSRKFNKFDTIHDLKCELQDNVEQFKDSEFLATFDFDPESYDLFAYYK